MTSFYAFSKMQSERNSLNLGDIFMKIFRFLALLLIIIGALNWGLWGFFQIDIIQVIFKSDTSIIARIVYAIVGIAGLYGISFFFNPCVYGCSCTQCQGGSKKEEENK